MNLTFETFLPLLPVGILALTTVVVMLAIAFVRHHWWNATLTVIGLNVALVSVLALVWSGHGLIFYWFRVNVGTCVWHGCLYPSP